MVDYKQLGLNAGGIISNNVGGLIYSVKNSAGNSAIDQGFDSILSPMGITGTVGKAVKTLVYDALGLLSMEFTEDKTETLKVAGNYLAQVATGLGTSTIAADPTYVNAMPGAATQAISERPAQPITSISGAIM